VQKTVIALGFFDGLHLGHAALLRRAAEVAWQIGATPAMLTFDTHPDELAAGIAVPLITSPEERAAIARELFGIDNMIVLHFDEELRATPWEKFLDELIAEFGAVHFVAGYDFRFGSRAEGTAEKLQRKILEIHNSTDPRMGCDIIPPVLLDGQTVSSTLIRQMLAAGQIEAANRFLGHTYRLTDTVKFGYKLGRTLGTPTINMAFPPHTLAPKHGVYATRLKIEDEREYRYAVTNVGIRPTVSNSNEVSVESHILEFDRIVYGKRVKLEFLRFIREERKFDNLSDLKSQIQKDIVEVRGQMAEGRWQILPPSQNVVA